MNTRYKDDFFICPNCGDEVRVGAAACPHCGADERTGWAEDADDAADYGGGYAGDDDFDYDAFVEREFGGGSKRPSPRKMVVGAIVTLIAIALIWMLLSV